MVLSVSTCCLVQQPSGVRSLDNDFALMSSEAAEKHGLTEPDRVVGALECQDYAVQPGVDENSQTNGIADDRQSLSSADNLVCPCHRASRIPRGHPSVCRLLEDAE